MPVALIIGASRGIGREFARQLLADRWRVFATARDDGAIAELQANGAAAGRFPHPDSRELGWRSNVSMKPLSFVT
jgi:NAD(P)-dependent dehydrogenase (short-subunit alcohol dehydrogenase family)